MAGISITTPVARWVQGDIWKGQTKDMSGNPLVYKSGPDAGKPRVNYFLGIAIPKAGEQHWNQTPWGMAIWNEGITKFPAAPQRPNFAWKIIDGDSQVPNDKGKKPCDQEGFPGHWILRLGGAFAPSVSVYMGGKWTEVTDPTTIKRGDYVQVQMEAEFNGDSNGKPGMYLNYRGVVLNRPGEAIKGGEFDANSAGFAAPAQEYNPGSPAGFGGAAAPPVGAPAPVAQQFTMTAAAQFTREQYHASGWTDAMLIAQGMMVAVQPAAPTQVPAAAAPAPAAAAPHPGILNGPAAAAPAAPTAPVAPPAGPVYQMTEKAGGLTREQYHASNWTDDLLLQHGYMIKVG